MTNKNCKYYPCHDNIESCSTCYCPAYPCNLTETGGKLHKGVWDCSNCTIIHKKNVAWIIKNKSLYEIKVALNNLNRK